MSKDEIAGTLIAVLSSIFAGLSYLWSIGFLQLIFTFLAGSFTTYVVQHRLQIESEKRKTKRDNSIVMRDEIFGPIFMEVSAILEDVQQAKSIDWGISEKLKGVMAHYLFSTINQDLRTKLSQVLDRFEKYERIRRAAELVLQEIIKKEMETVYHVDIGMGEHIPSIGLFIGKIQVAWITLMRSLLVRMEPQDFVRTENQKWGNGVLVNVSGIPNLSDFELLYERLLNEIEKEPIYVEEKKQRTLLEDELKAFLEQIKVFVNLE